MLKTRGQQEAEASLDIVGIFVRRLVQAFEKSVWLTGQQDGSGYVLAYFIYPKRITPFFLN